jgi:Tfp pilus assembly protein PilV
MHAGRSRMTSQRVGRVLTSLLRDASGITLIESLIASVVVGVGVIGLAVMLGTGQSVLSAEGDNRVAVFLAQQAIEHCRWQGFARATAGTTTEKIDASSSVADASNPCAPASASNILTTNCTTSTTICYARTTVVDCVSTSDYTASADCTATPTPPKRITVTVRGGAFVAGNVQLHAKDRPVILRSVLANR